MMTVGCQTSLDRGQSAPQAVEKHTAALSGENLAGANLAGVVLLGGNLLDADLSGTVLTGARMPDNTIHP